VFFFGSPPKANPAEKADEASNVEDDAAEENLTQYGSFIR